MIQVLQKTADVLDVLAQEGEISLRELVARTGMKKPTVWAILDSLKQIGYVEKRAGSLYALGGRFLTLAQMRSRHHHLQQIAQACAAQLAEEVKETVIAAATINGVRHTLARATYQQSVVADAQASPQHAAFYDTTTGRILLAFMDAQNLDKVINAFGLPDERWEGITSRSGLEKALTAIRKQGRTQSHSADGQAMRIAVPVYGPDGNVWAALGVSLPTSRFRSKHKTAVLHGLANAADRMSTQLLLATETDPPA